MIVSYYFFCSFLRHSCQMYLSRFHEYIEHIIATLSSFAWRTGLLVRIHRVQKTKIESEGYITSSNLIATYSLRGLSCIEIEV